ncbi:MAG: acyltransferase family protein [Bacteroidaceae bacterium]|nr:acyltransferase family protein [Bacteroidaceae bacterium]
MTKQRMTWADAARGAAILLVLIGHSCPPPYTTAFIYAFHMPLFFILSGLFLQLDAPLKTLWWKKVRTLLVPFVIYNLVLLCSDWCIVALSPNQHTPVDIPARLLGTLTGWRSGSWSSSLWFLPALFTAQWLVIGCHKLGQRLGEHSSTITVALWVLLSVVGVAYCLWVGTALPMCLDAALVATGFLLMGRQWLHRGLSGYAGWYWVVTAIVFAVSAIDNFHSLGGGDHHVDMSTDTLGHPFQFYIAAAAGSMLLIRCCQLLQESDAPLGPQGRLIRQKLSPLNFPLSTLNAFLQWAGRNSLAIYCLHRIPMNLGIAFTNLVPWLNEPTAASQATRSLLLVLFTLLLLLPAVLIVNRWFPWTLGRKASS